ncbi:hypothetical protein ColTof4_04528 [Colletotrichum tofieldiae]|nr:hypothetical protein ColTof3_11236 [Colletotrichum tofieldiae]GKT72105.1 hypothetical protein ColTof4_04528 [Colletotrichum tofieldiae]
MPLYRASTLCILVLMLSNGIDAYLHGFHQHKHKRAPNAPVERGPPHRNTLLKHRKRRKPHCAVRALLAKHGRQPAPQAPHTIFADQHADGAEKPAVREPAVGGGRVVDHLGLDCLAGRDDGDALRHAGAEATDDVDPRRARLSLPMARDRVGFRAGEGVESRAGRLEGEEPDAGLCGVGRCESLDARVNSPHAGAADRVAEDGKRAGRTGWRRRAIGGLEV